MLLTELKNPKNSGIEPEEISVTSYKVESIIMFDVVLLFGFLGFVYLVAFLLALRYICFDGMAIDPPVVYGPHPKHQYTSHDV